MAIKERIAAGRLRGTIRFYGTPAEGAALAAGVESRIAIQTGSRAKLANRTMARLFHSNMADVSWIVPTAELEVTTAPVGAPWHAWPVVACAGMSIGHKGMIYAAEVLAATMVDLFEDADLRERIRQEFAQKTKGVVYKPYIPEGPPPLPKP